MTDQVLIPNDTITVHINGLPYLTHIDEHGNQRFVGNPIVRVLMLEMMKPVAEWVMLHEQLYDTEWEEEDRPFGMVNLADMYITGKFTFEQYLDFHAFSGYRLDTLVQIPAFANIILENSYQKEEVVDNFRLW
jgi:hypothetical protein